MKSAIGLLPMWLDPPNGASTTMVQFPWHPCIYYIYSLSLLGYQVRVLSPLY